MPAHFGCKDANCHGCRAAREGLELAAFWRPRNGKDTFMGIVRHPTTDMDASPIFIKLDDPKGELEGPGHVMTDMEFMTECSHYDHATGSIAFMYLPCMRRDSIAELINEEDMEAFQRNHAVGVLSFHDKPEDFTDVEDDHFDEKYPPIVGVRAGDRVKIVAAGLMVMQKGMAPFRERFWVHVTSVTSFGMITGITPNELHGCNISEETGFLSFDISAVLGVMKGEHWETNKSAENKEES